jgi:hypothetical protein
LHDFAFLKNKKLITAAKVKCRARAKKGNFLFFTGFFLMLHQTIAVV